MKSACLNVSGGKFKTASKTGADISLVRIRRTDRTKIVRFQKDSKKKRKVEIHPFILLRKRSNAVVI